MFSQKSTSVFVSLMMIIACAVLVSCGGSQLEENPCASQEGNCIFVTFDGTNCEVVGPTDNHVGEYTVIFSNQSEGEARVEVVWIYDDKTIEDLEEDIRDSPTSYRSWVIGAGFWNQIVDPGETATMTSSTTMTTSTRQFAGDYGVVCDRIPHYVVFGSGFTLIE